MYFVSVVANFQNKIKQKKKKRKKKVQRLY